MEVKAMSNERWSGKDVKTQKLHSDDSEAFGRDKTRGKFNFLIIVFTSHTLILLPSCSSDFGEINNGTKRESNCEMLWEKW